jgi:endonuclease/exonuclease/phosphatase family metal-dependent hydrolase
MSDLSACDPAEILPDSLGFAHQKGVPMPATARRVFIVTFLLGFGPVLGAWAADKPTVKVMTRNMDAGTDLNFIFAATDVASLVQGTAATLAEIKESQLQQRAAQLAAEIAAAKPDLVALQEVTLWRTGKLMSPPAATVLFDQLQYLQDELARLNLSYRVAAINNTLDAEAPVPTEGLNLRITDRDAILVRNDLPQPEFDTWDAQAYRYSNAFVFGSDLLGRINSYRGWMAVDVLVRGQVVRFVNTHLETAIPGIPATVNAQTAQAGELLLNLSYTDLPVILAGDFNCNAETGTDHFAATENIVAAGFTDIWKSLHPSDLGYTWPLFGEDQLAGPATPFERIDIIFTRGVTALSVDRIGAEKPASGPWASDHAGVVATIQLGN